MKILVRTFDAHRGAEAKFPLVTRVYGSNLEFDVKVNYHGESSVMQQFREQFKALQMKNIEEMVALQQKQEANIQALYMSRK